MKKFLPFVIFFSLIMSPVFGDNGPSVATEEFIHGRVIDKNESIFKVRVLDLDHNWIRELFAEKEFLDQLPAGRECMIVVEKKSSKVLDVIPHRYKKI